MALTKFVIEIDNCDLKMLNEMVDRAVQQAITDTPKRVPSGYRCANCFRDDGGHDAGCEVALAGMVQSS